MKRLLLVVASRHLVVKYGILTYTIARVKVVLIWMRNLKLSVLVQDVQNVWGIIIRWEIGIATIVFVKNAYPGSAFHVLPEPSQCIRTIPPA